jgi:hypothetical protein
LAARNPIGNWIRKSYLSRERWSVLRIVGEDVMFLILLRQNIQSDMYVDDMDRY